MPVMKLWRFIFAAFLTWIVTRILRLLASEQCSPLHPKALECFNNILHVCCVCTCVMHTDMNICTYFIMHIMNSGFFTRA